MLKTVILRMFLFVVFFSIGAAALMVSVAVDDFVRYYKIRNQLEETEKSIQKMENLISEYQAVITQLQTDPNTAKRLGTVALGSEPSSEDTAFPKTSIRKLAAAKNTLNQDAPQNQPEQTLPRWVIRSSSGIYRIPLFLAGAGLIIIAFACFGYRHRADRDKHKSVKLQ